MDNLFDSSRQILCNIIRGRGSQGPPFKLNMTSKIHTIIPTLALASFLIWPISTFALSLPIPNVNPLNYVKPINNLINTAAQNQGIGTSIPTLHTRLNSLASSKNFSTSDVLAGIKAGAILGINLFLIVIQTVAGILKALLPFLK